MIKLQANWALYLNILMALIVLGSLISGFRKGLLKGVISLVRMVISFIVATWFSGPLAKVFPLLNYKAGTVAEFITKAFELHGSKLIWFVILFFGTYLVTMILEWIFGFVDDIPIVSTINRVAGLAFGFVLAYIKLFMVLVFLVSPVFKNAQPLINASYMKLVQESSGKIKALGNLVSDSLTTQKLNNKENLNQTEVNRLESLLKQYGLTQDQIVDYLEGLK